MMELFFDILEANTTAHYSLSMLAMVAPLEMQHPRVCSLVAITMLALC